MKDLMSPAQVERLLIEDPIFPLHSAVAQGDLQRIDHLLANGYDINTSIEWIERKNPLQDLGTPLHTAIWCNQWQAFEMLLDHDADIDVLDEGTFLRRCQDTPIRLAVRLGRRKMVKRLWDAGAMQKKYHSAVPMRLHHVLIEVASCEGQVGVLKDLIDWSNELTDREWFSSLNEARKELRDDVVATLLNEHSFSAYELESTVRSVSQKTHYPTEDEPNISPEELVMAAKEDSQTQANIIELLLNARAKVQNGEGYDETSLLNMLLPSVLNSPFKVCTLKMMLERGADPNLEDRYGQTPLYFALKRWQITDEGPYRCNKEGVALLLAYGARVDRPDREGITPLEHAKRSGEDPSFIQKLEKFMQP